MTASPPAPAIAALMPTGARLSVISPHLDDAVLGCGALLAAYPGSVAITAFAGRPDAYPPLTSWDARAGYGEGDDVVMARREEDRAAFQAAGGFERRFFIGGEEELLTLDLTSAGWGLAYVDDLTVHHLPSSAGRDDDRRRMVQVRNRLWVAWLRRPLPVALAKTLQAVRSARTDPATRAGLLAALRGLPWALRRRRAVPRRVERQIRHLERLAGR